MLKCGTIQGEFKILLSTPFSPTGVILMSFETKEIAKEKYQIRMNFEKKEIIYRLKKIIQIPEKYKQLQIDVSKGRARRMRIMKKYFEAHY